MPYAIQGLKTQFSVSSAINEHISHLLLPVPSFDGAGYLKGGGSLPHLLKKLPADITVIGGALTHPALDGYSTIDLLDDPMFLAENANITAHCAVGRAMQALPLTMEDSRVLILGWGRIGKCLALLLKRMGAEVSVAARKETDLAMAASLGFTGIPFQQAQYQLCDIVFNTIPVPVLTELFGNPIKIDLASCKSIPGEDVIWARFLPAADAPASTGRLIARTIGRILDKEVIT